MLRVLINRPKLFVVIWWGRRKRIHLKSSYILLVLLHLPLLCTICTISTPRWSQKVFALSSWELIDPTINMCSSLLLRHTWRRRCLPQPGECRDSLARTRVTRTGRQTSENKITNARVLKYFKPIFANCFVLLPLHWPSNTCKLFWRKPIRV